MYFDASFHRERDMSTIDANGMLIDPRVISRRSSGIEHGALPKVLAIVVHQTDSSTAESSLNSYGDGGNGAHFLIDKNGQIYQTASLHSRCYHVGKLIKSKCLTVNKNTCHTAAMAKMLAMSWIQQINALDAHERAKSYPDRYPVNSEAIGIELVGLHIDEKTYEAVTAAQNTALQWLIDELYAQFNLKPADVYRHPTVSYKNPGEASSAIWK